MAAVGPGTAGNGCAFAPVLAVDADELDPLGLDRLPLVWAGHPGVVTSPKATVAVAAMERKMRMADSRGAG